VILPLMSALRFTAVRGSTLPLAVTDATRSRASTGSTRTSTAPPSFWKALHATRLPTPITAAARIDSFTFLLMLSSGSQAAGAGPGAEVGGGSAEPATDGVLERRVRPMILIDRVDTIDLGLREDVARLGDLDEGRRPYTITLLGQSEGLAGGSGDLVVELGALVGRLE